MRFQFDMEAGLAVGNQSPNWTRVAAQLNTIIIIKIILIWGWRSTYLLEVSNYPSIIIINNSMPIALFPWTPKRNFLRS